MKKTIIIFIVIGGIIGTMFFINNLKIKSFSINEYKTYIENFSSELVLGEIENEKIAKEKAEKIWIEMYGEKVKEKKPYKIKYDKDNNVWLIYGSIKKNHLGGVPYIIIRKEDGKVLAIWHEK